MAKRRRITTHERARVWAESGGDCFCCGADMDPFTFAVVEDDRTPLPEGAPRTDALVAFCESCTALKGTRSLSSFSAHVAACLRVALDLEAAIQIRGTQLHFFGEAPPTEGPAVPVAASPDAEAQEP